MSKRNIYVDPSEARKDGYKKLDLEASAAIWEALEILSKSGIDIGPKATNILAKRAEIKAKAPKP
tara:strand:- start:586 stop:780 length:195 start_codon:yes stop_codon:yes gene_type:complete